MLEIREKAREVCERLRVGPGYRLRDVLDEQGVRLEKGAAQYDDPFVAFTERASDADEEAYGDL